MNLDGRPNYHFRQLILSHLSPSMLCALRAFFPTFAVKLSTAPFHFLLNCRQLAIDNSNLLLIFRMQL